MFRGRLKRDAFIQYPGIDYNSMLSTPVKEIIFMMKLLKTLTLCAALSAASLSYAIDAKDAGEYVLLDMNQEPTPTQMRYYLQGDQWMMDGRQGGGNWSPVCEGTGSCRLKTSTAADVRKWRAMLPQELQQEPFSCIDNQIAFAFCSSAKKSNPDMRLYWWVSLLPNQTGLLRLNRLH